jgi:hypothetical protein
VSEKLLNLTKALIFRITHVDNVPWILDHGLHCRNSDVRDPNFREIGNRDLIAKRLQHPIPVEPGGTLADYVPFYFTPWSPMQMNIVTGYQGTPHTPASDIAFLVSSVPTLDANRLVYVLTDRHAYLATARFATDSRGLKNVDWGILQARDFERSDDDPGKVERYQAEALVHKHLPVEAIQGIVVRDQGPKSEVKAELQRRSLSIKLFDKPDWYFR